MANTASTIFLKDYQAPNFAIERIHLDFDLHEDEAFVTNQMSIKRLRPGPLHLNGDEIELLSIEIDGKPLSSEQYYHLKDDLVIENLPDEALVTVSTRIKPQENSKLSGLFRSNQLFCTQCEAEGFRRITLYPDRPDVLSSFTTKITADKEKYPVLLSNGNLIGQGQLDEGRHWALWEDPFKKPAYLFALVAGDLHCLEDSFTTASGKPVDLRIYAEIGNEDKCAHAMASLKKAMRWDEEMFGREYDLSTYMIVAVNDFNMGAMENKGLNIFNAKYILAKPESASDDDYRNVEGVVGHEYFHNWTGNRVTCRDWFQLSLKEGLTVFRDQEFTRDMNSRDVCRIEDVKVLRAAQFPEDEGALAHPVRPASYEEINNFYTATIYNKGAEVIRMQETLLGKAGFRRGMDLYFQRHDGQAVTIDDFLKAMEDANQVDFSQFALWYQQAGTPLVTVSTSFGNNTLKLTMAQSCRPTAECQDKRPFHIPIRVALFDKNGDALPLESEILELKEAEQSFEFKGLKEKPLISLLRDFSAPIRLEMEQSNEERLQLLRFETNGYIKWNIAQQLAKENIHALYAAKTLEPSQISPSLIEAFRTVIQDERLDHWLRAELLSPPLFEEAIASMQAVDVDKLEAARDFYRAELGRNLRPEAEALYASLSKKLLAKDCMEPASLRKLRNLCLRLLMQSEPERFVGLCRQQFIQADNMTDKVASFALLTNCPIAGVAEEAIVDFYNRWHKDALVMDKWFSIQAMSELPGTLERVKELLKHPAFSIKNPNKVRALIGAFVQGNPRHFHEASGEAYAFLSDKLIELDKLNPQIAARLACAFTRFKQFDVNRAVLMQEQLERLMRLKLSPDLAEVVSKSLKEAPQ